MKQIFSIILIVAAAFFMQSCETVSPNYAGVLMTDFGKNGKSDFSNVKGRVPTLAPGTSLYQVPLYELRANFDSLLHLKSSDNTEFTARPIYSFRVIENRAIDVVFENARLGAGDDFMASIEDNILEPHIYDLIKEESRKYTTDTLMANGGSLEFEQRIQKIIAEAFSAKGLELMSFSCNLDFSRKVKEKIDNRNEVNTNISVLDQQIIEQRKRNELIRLTTEGNKIRSEGLTDQILKERAIDGWIQHGCPTPTYIGNPSQGIYLPVQIKN